MTGDYAKQDHQLAAKANSEWMKRSKTPVGDYQTYLDEARRQREYSTPLAKRLYGGKQP